MARDPHSPICPACGLSMRHVREIIDEVGRSASTVFECRPCGVTYTEPRPEKPSTCVDERRR